MFFLYKPVQLVHAKKVLLQDRKFGQIFEENIVREKSGQCGEDLYFINKKNKYIWDERIQMFRKLTNIDQTLNQSDFYKMHGLNPTDVRERMRVSTMKISVITLIILLQTFGANIIKISVPPVLHLIIHEVSSQSLPTSPDCIFSICLQGLNPFFLFQAYTVILWTLQWYWKFALIIAVTTVITVTLSVWETRKVGTEIISIEENISFCSKTGS